MVLPASDRVSRAPPYSGTLSRSSKLRIRDSHSLWLAFPDHSAVPRLSLLSAPQPQRVNSLVWAIAVSLATTSAISDLISFPPATEMFQLSGFARLHYWFMKPYCLHSGFPHSDIFGSKPIRRFPEAYRSLSRLSSLPRAKASTIRP